MLKQSLPAFLLPVLVTLVACGGGSNTPSSTDINGDTSASAGVNTGDGTQAIVDGNVGGNTTTTGTQPSTGFALPDISQVNQFGWVSVDEYSDEVKLSASFFSFDDEVTPTEALVSLILPPLDTCSIVKKSIAALDPTGFGIPADITFQVISAGEVLVFSSEQGTVASLIEQSQFGFKFYVAEPGVTLTPPLATNLTLSIPGADFPAFAQATVPNVNALVGSALVADASVAVNESFTWTGDSDPFSRVIIQLEGLDADQDAVNIECDVVDDGEFSLLPAYAQALATNQQLTYKQMQREVFSVAIDGGSALLVYHTNHP